MSWQSLLLVEETRVPGENNRPAASHLSLWRELLSQFHYQLLCDFFKLLVVQYVCMLYISLDNE
jgi:hypothetical protein